jgi:hypothetical protein
MVATKVRRDVDFIGTHKLIDHAYRLCNERPQLSPEAVSVETLNSTPAVRNTNCGKGAYAPSQSALQTGAHLDLVGGYTPQTREADDAAARRSRIFVDHCASAFDGVGEILHPIASGAIRKEDVLGDLYVLVGGGVPGRLGTNDITFFKSAGSGHLDLMTAQAIMSQLDAV